MMDLNSKLEKCMGQQEYLSPFIQCFPLGIICRKTEFRTGGNGTVKNRRETGNGDNGEISF